MGAGIEGVTPKCIAAVFTGEKKGRNMWGEGFAGSTAGRESKGMFQKKVGNQPRGEFQREHANLSIRGFISRGKGGLPQTQGGKGGEGRKNNLNTYIH